MQSYLAPNHGGKFMAKQSHQMTKAFFPKASLQAGFAVSIVFLALALIAVTLAAISLMGGASQSNSIDTENRLVANQLIRTAGDGQRAFLTMMNQNGLQADQIFAYRRMADGSTDGVSSPSSSYGQLYNRKENLFGPSGTWALPKAIVNAYTTPSACDPSEFEQEGNDGAATCMLHFTRVWTSNYGAGAQGVTAPTGTDSAPRSATYIVYTTPVAPAVGFQINNLLWGAPLTTAFDTAATVSSLQKLVPPTTVGGQTVLQGVTTTGSAASSSSIATAQLPEVSGAVRPEGMLIRGSNLVYFKTIYSF
jgi:Tfp pilus assembly protein PilV